MAESFLSPERAELTACRRLARLRRSRLRQRVNQDRVALREVACDQVGCHLTTLPAADIPVAGDDAVTIAFLPVVSTIVTTRGAKDDERGRVDREMLAQMQDPACAAVFGG